MTLSLQNRIAHNCTLDGIPGRCVKREDPNGDICVIVEIHTLDIPKEHDLKIDSILKGVFGWIKIMTSIDDPLLVIGDEVEGE